MRGPSATQKRGRFSVAQPSSPVTYRKTSLHISPPARSAASSVLQPEWKGDTRGVFRGPVAGIDKHGSGRPCSGKASRNASSGKGRSGRCREKAVTDATGIPVGQDAARQMQDFPPHINFHPHLPGCRSSRRRESAAVTFVYLKRFGYLNRFAETLQILRAVTVPHCRHGLNRSPYFDARWMTKGPLR